MEIAQITPDLVETTLKQWRQAQEAPLTLLDLDLLQPFSPTLVERSMQLYDQLVNLVLEQLNTYRQAEGLTLTSPQSRQRQSLLLNLAGDFRFSNPTLEAWSLLFHRYLAPIHFSVHELASAAGVEERQVRRRLELGLRLLTDLLRRAEQGAHQQQQTQRLLRHLPPVEQTRLFGIDQYTAQIADLLNNPTGPRFVSIEGLGGIGKTTLARAVAERLAQTDCFQAILWVQARQTRLTEAGTVENVDNPVHTAEDILERLGSQLGLVDVSGMTMAQLQTRLQTIFTARPHLIVVDNLETLVDVQAVLTMLTAFAGSSRFLLTSRHTLRYTPMLQTFQTPELSFEHSVALLCCEVRRKNQCCDLSPRALEQIYDAIGGLPLAIRLVAAQIGRLPLTVILDGLKHARCQMPERMYTYIYRRTWQLLSHAARHLLLSMLLVAPDGEAVPWIGNMSGLPETEAQQALIELVDYSLVGVRGCSEHPLYKLHRLTHTFLQSEVLLQWEGSDV